MTKYFGYIIFGCSFFCLKAQIITTVVGNGTQGYAGDGGPAISGELSHPHCIAIDINENIYIADYNNYVVRKVNASGIITTFAGNGIQGYSGDGGLATLAQLSYCQSVAVDGSGNVYIGDDHRIRKVDASGNINTIAGTGFAGFSGDGGPAISAKLSNLLDVFVDNNYNILIVDLGNRRIRMVNPSGIIATIAGNGVNGYSGDGGQATLAELNFPRGVMSDAIGNIYIADQANNVIRKINSAGIISTIAGNGLSGYTGDGGIAISAELNAPSGMVLDNIGNLYIADLGNYVVRKIDNTGVISTIAGNGTVGYSGDGGQAVLAELANPSSVAFDTSGNLFICDLGNNVIRKVTGVAGSNFIKNKNEQFLISPNPGSGLINISFSEIITQVKISNSLGNVILENKPQKNYASFQLENPGIYFVTISSNEKIMTQKIIISR